MLESPTPVIDVMRPFQLERSQLRGRFVRLGSTVDTVLKAHDYPKPVSDLLGELLVLAGGLAGGLKFDGVFSLQVRGNGPIRLMVADITNDGQMRGYANFDDSAAHEPTDGTDEDAFARLVGAGGHLALTVDQSSTGGESYQGIVELDGRSLRDSMLSYFRRSEQVLTGIRTAVGHDHGSGRWCAGAIIMQAMPEDGPGRLESMTEDGGDSRAEDWRRAMILLHSATDGELLDPDLPLDRLLFRLFHEEGVRVFEPRDIAFGCRCDEDRVVRMLRHFPMDEIEEMRTDTGEVVVTCQFCSRVYAFDDAKLAAIFKDRSH